FYVLAPGVRATTAGIEIHANAIETILDRRFLVPLPAAASMVLLFVCAGAAAGAACYSKPRRALLIALALGAAALVVSQWLFGRGTVVPIARVLECLLLSAIAALLYQAENRRAFFAAAFSIFVGRRAARSLEESEQISVASGSRQQV